MNGWDLFTYLMCALLASSAIVIFILFLRDARSIIEGSAAQEDEEEGEDWS